MADLDLAAELGADRLLAVADAEHRHAQLEHRVRGAAGAAASVVEAGPPDRMIALGANARIVASSTVHGRISQ